MNLKDRGFLKRIIESYLIAFALMNACGRKTTDMFTVLFFVTAFVLLGKKAVPQQKKDCVISGLLACVLTAFYVLGNYEALSGGLTNKLFLLFYFGCTIAGLLSLFYEGVLAVLVNSTKVSLFEEKKSFPIKGFWISAGVVFLCMVPFLLTNYPGVMTPDSLAQYRQAAGISGYNDHHPWMHTLLIEFFYKIGYGITQNTYSAIAFYTIVQMFLVAVSVAYVWSALYEMGLKKLYCILGIALFLIYPYNLIYGVTMWKDILFSMAVLVLTITLFRLHCFIKEGRTVRAMLRDWVLYVVCGFFMCMLRHNGFYAFLVLMLLLAVVFRRQWKIFIPLTAGIVCICFIIKGPVMDAADVEPGKYAYKVCIPLQQIARVITDGCELTEEETALLEKINTIDYIPENYQRGGADPMFAWVIYGDQQYLIDHQAEYFKLWVSIGLRYPGKYIQAFLDQTKGYWYPMDPEQVVYFGITENENGLVSQPVFSGPAVVKFHELLTKLYTIFPLYGIFYSMGGMLWIFLLLMAAAIRNRNDGAWIAGVPLLLLTLTLFIAVPLVADIRYGYPLLITVPAVAAFTFYKGVSQTDRMGKTQEI